MLGYSRFAIFNGERRARNARPYGNSMINDVI